MSKTKKGSATVILKPEYYEQFSNTLVIHNDIEIIKWLVENLDKTSWYYTWITLAKLRLYFKNKTDCIHFALTFNHLIIDEK